MPKRKKPDSKPKAPAAAPPKRLSPERAKELQERIRVLEQEVVSYQSLMRGLLEVAASAEQSMRDKRQCRCGATLGETNTTGLCAFCEAMERST